MNRHWLDRVEREGMRTRRRAIDKLSQTNAGKCEASEKRFRRGADVNPPRIV